MNDPLLLNVKWKGQAYPISTALPISVPLSSPIQSEPSDPIEIQKLTSNLPAK